VSVGEGFVWNIKVIYRETIESDYEFREDVQEDLEEEDSLESDESIFTDNSEKNNLTLSYRHDMTQ